MSPVGAGHCRMNTQCCAFLLRGGGSVACPAPLPHLRGFWKVPPAARCSHFHMVVFLLLSHRRHALLQVVALHSPRPCRPALASGHSTLCFILLSRISVVSCDGVWHATFDVAVPCVGRGPCSRLSDARPEQELLGTVCWAMLASGLRSSFRLLCTCPGACSLTRSGVGGGHRVFSVPSGLAHTPLSCFIPPPSLQPGLALTASPHKFTLSPNLQPPSQDTGIIRAPRARPTLLQLQPPTMAKALPSASCARHAHHSGALPSSC